MGVAQHHFLAIKMYEPSPRYGAYSSPVEGKLYMRGGRTDNKEKNDSVEIHVWEPLKENWLQHTTAGSLPPSICRGASTSTGSCMYRYAFNTLVHKF